MIIALILILGTLQLHHGTASVKADVPMGCYASATPVGAASHVVVGWQQNTGMIWIWSPKRDRLAQVRWQVVCD